MGLFTCVSSFPWDVNSLSFKTMCYLSLAPPNSLARGLAQNTHSVAFLLQSSHYYSASYVCTQVQKGRSSIGLPPLVSSYSILPTTSTDCLEAALDACRLQAYITASSFFTFAPSTGFPSWRLRIEFLFCLFVCLSPPLCPPHHVHSSYPPVLEMVILYSTSNIQHSELA